MGEGDNKLGDCTSLGQCAGCWRPRCAGAPLAPPPIPRERALTGEVREAQHLVQRALAGRRQRQRGKGGGRQVARRRGLRLVLLVLPAVHGGVVAAVVAAVRLRVPAMLGVLVGRRLLLLLLVRLLLGQLAGRQVVAVALSDLRQGSSAGGQRLERARE